ncbi:MAG: cytochrome c [Chloroflexi bacterium]|nr:cytochrome c [Chloroflexota bacterium]
MKRFTFATIAAVVVSSLAVGLLAIGARSPYTHANLLPRFDPRYVRTEQALVGLPAQYRGAGLEAPPPASGGLAARGRVLLVGKGCAACHGLEGRGGVVGPTIVGFNALELRAKTDKGPGGMPAYRSGELADADLEAIAAYLKSSSE